MNNDNEHDKANTMSDSNFTKCAINELSINKNIILYGKQVLEQMNLEKVGVNEKAQRNCCKQMSSDVLKDVAVMNKMEDRNNGEDSGDDFMTNSIQRLQDTVVTNGEDA